MIKNWEKFNEELNYGTYTNAAFKLKKFGHKERADKLRQHAENMMSKTAKEKWNIDKLQFEGGVVGEFSGFGLPESWDMYWDNEQDFISIVFYVKLDKKFDDSNIYSIVISYDKDEDIVHYFSYDEEAFEEAYGKKVLKFGNRKDALKVINAIKKIDFFDVYDENPVEEIEEYKKDFDKLISKISINELYVTK